MLAEVILGVAVGVSLLLLFAPSPKPLSGIYSQPGKLFYLKKWMMYCSIRLLRMRHKNDARLETVNQGSSLRFKAGHPVKALESPQKLCHQTDKEALDSLSFNGMRTDGSRLSVSIARRRDREVEVRLSVTLPGAGQFQWPAHPHTLQYNTDGKTFSAGGLNFEKGFHDEWSEPNEDILVHVKFCLRWVAFSDPFNYDTEVDPWLSADAIARERWTTEFWKELRQLHTHYEQWGELRGLIHIEKQEERILYLRGCKVRRTGMQGKKSVHRHVAHYGYVEDGTTFNVTAVSLPRTTSHLKCGYLNWPSASQYPVTWTDLSLPHLGEEPSPPTQYSFSFIANGKKFVVCVEEYSTALYYTGHNWSGALYQMMCHVTVNGKKGCGLAEFYYDRSGGDCPVAPQPLMALLQEPDAPSPEGKAALVLAFDNPSCCHSELVGSKGCQLATLSQMCRKQATDFSVPAGFCLTLAAFEKQIQQSSSNSDRCDLQETLKILSETACGKRSGDLKGRCEATVNAFLETPLCVSVQEAIKKGIDDLFPGKCTDDERFAIRSSAAGEDGEELSAAGQMETLLGVKGLEKICEAVVKCWSSTYAFQAVEYRRQHGQPITCPVAVVIQKMVDADTAGVLFTVDPMDGNPMYITINANYGLGESVVSGMSEPDTITVRRLPQGGVRIVKKDIGSKRLKQVLAETGGITKLDVTSEEAVKACMADDVILRLAQIGIQLENSFGSPRDIEWAFVDGRISVLQARPITSLRQESDWELLHEFDTARKTDKAILTRHNIGEVLPNALTPFEVRRHLTVDYMTQVLKMTIGIQPHIRAFHTWTAIISGKIFIDLHESTSLHQEMILGSDHRFVILSLCGCMVPELDMEAVREYHGSVSLWRRLVHCVRQWMSLLSGRKSITLWAERLKTYRIQTQNKTARQLFDDVTGRTLDLLECWVAHTVSTTFSIVWKTVILNILSKGKTELTTEQYGDMAVLFSKTIHNEACSADVPGALQELAAIIKEQNPSFSHQPPKEALKWLQEDTNQSGRSFSSFLDTHGYRGAGELELYKKSWVQDPIQLIPSLQAMAMATEMPKNSLNTVDDTNTAIGSLKSPTTPVTRWFLKRIVPRARRAAGNREWTKALCARLHNIFRQACWKLASLMVEEGKIPEEDLMFYLTESEIDHILDNPSGRILARIYNGHFRARRRRRLHAQQEKLDFPILFSGRIEPTTKTEQNTDRQGSEPLQIQGTPVSLGFARGAVRVVHSIEEAHTIQAGEILVVEATDVGWSPYFPLISGLVTEIGGLLSHGVVVAREYGIPCVVNVANATALFKTGDVVALNGKEGTVERIVQ